MEAILVEWDLFARTLYPPNTHMTPRMLRDHGEQILEAVVRDLDTAQSAAEQAEKSKGNAPEVLNAPKTAAQTHAVLRAQSGIDINQLAAEYRALRASVLRLWEQTFEPGVDGLQEVIRFNEAIDQALAESIAHFSAQVERTRNLLLGMLGHDMRSPLSAVMMTADCLAELDAGETVSEAADCLKRSGASIQTLVNDLMDFSRTSLGMGIAITVQEADLAELLADEVKQLRAANPASALELQVEGDVRGRWDGARLKQVLRNLVSNARAYGTPKERVRVGLRGENDAVTFTVTNRGAAIDPASLKRLFEPLVRGSEEARSSNKDGLGLGLFIVREIVQAHGGEVTVRSEAPETVFSVRLPRVSKSSGAA